MDEAVGTRIVTHATHAAHQRAVADGGELHIGEAEVNGLALHVLALGRNMAANAVQEGVGGGRTIAADNLDRNLRAHVGMQFPQQVDGARIDGDGFVAAPVAQHVVDLLEAVLDELAVALVDGGDRLLGVDVVEGDGALAGLGGDHLKGSDRRQDRRRCGAGAQCPFTRDQCEIPRPNPVVPDRRTLVSLECGHCDVRGIHRRSGSRSTKHG
mgnify:CR=1 FL=1